MGKGTPGQAQAGAMVRSAMRNGSSPVARTEQSLSEREIEDRTKIYGPVPPPRPRVRMSPEGRALLIPRILELQGQGLTIALVAKEMGIKSSQVERALKDWREKR